MLIALEKNDFENVYSIMEDSFCTDEFRPYLEQYELLEKTNYKIYVLKDYCTKSVKAFIALWQFKDFCFIEHFAVDRKYRGEGIGSMIIKEITKMRKCPICLEVEPPKTDVAKKRIEFYEQNGFCLNNYSYIQPPISENRKAIPLLIMTSSAKISEETFEYYKSVLYEKVYGVETCLHQDRK